MFLPEIPLPSDGFFPTCWSRGMSESSTYGKQRICPCNSALAYFHVSWLSDFIFYPKPLYKSLHQSFFYSFITILPSENGVTLHFTARFYLRPSHFVFSFYKYYVFCTIRLVVQTELKVAFQRSEMRRKNPCLVLFLLCQVQVGCYLMFNYCCINELDLNCHCDSPRTFSLQIWIQPKLIISQRDFIYKNIHVFKKIRNLQEQIRFKT